MTTLEQLRAFVLAMPTQQGPGVLSSRDHISREDVVTQIDKLRAEETQMNSLEARSGALAQLREAFDAMLVAEVKRHNGIPHLSPEEGTLREAIAALLAGGSPFPQPQEVICDCGTVMVCPDLGCDKHKRPGGAREPEIGSPSPPLRRAEEVEPCVHTFVAKWNRHEIEGRICAKCGHVDLIRAKTIAAPLASGGSPEAARPERCPQCDEATVCGHEFHDAAPIPRAGEGE